MKTPPRFYAPEMTAESATVDLPEDEARHLIRVLRLGEGAAVQALNGRGLLRGARVATATKSHATLELGDPLPAAVESAVHLTLAQALLKGDKMDDVVRDAAMAGAAAILPLITSHTEPAIVRGAERRVGRWQAIAVGSAKQSGRAVVPAIGGPVPLREAVERAAGERIALVEPSAASGNAAFRRTAAPPADATLFVGPEGGWSADEIGVFEAAGAALVTLPGPTWRADAIGLIALVLADVAWRGRAGWGL